MSKFSKEIIELAHKSPEHMAFALAFLIASNEIHGRANAPETANLREWLDEISVDDIQSVYHDCMIIYRHDFPEGYPTADRCMEILREKVSA